MELSCKSCLSEQFHKLLHGIIVQGLSFETISWAFAWICLVKGISQSYLSNLYASHKRPVRQRSWAQSELCWAQSSQSVHNAVCSSRAQVALRSYFWSFCIELSCQSCLAELFLKLLHGAVVQNELCQTIFRALAWNWRAKAALRGYCWSFCAELSRKSCLATLLLKVLHVTVMQKLLHKAIS